MEPKKKFLDGSGPLCVVRVADSGGVGQGTNPASFLNVGGLSVRGVSLPWLDDEACPSNLRRRGSGFLRGVPAGLVMGFGW